MSAAPEGWRDMAEAPRIHEAPILLLIWLPDWILDGTLYRPAEFEARVGFFTRDRGWIVPDTQCGGYYSTEPIAWAALPPIPDLAAAAVMQQKQRAT